MSSTYRAERRALWEIRALSRLATDGLLPDHLSPGEALTVIAALTEEALTRPSRATIRGAIGRAIDALDAFETGHGPEQAAALDSLKHALRDAREMSS